MPPKKRKGDASSIAEAETPSKKKMTKKEKEASLERAAAWATERKGVGIKKPTPKREAVTTKRLAILH